MMTISSVLKTLSVATFATTAAVSMVAPAEAINLNGSLSLSGNATVPNGKNPATTTIRFDTVDIDDLVGDFEAILFPTSDSLNRPVVANLNLIRTMVLDSTSPNFSATYEAEPTVSFINFGTQTIDGLTSQLTFDLLTASFVRSSFGNPANFVSLNPVDVLSGVFKFNGDTIANGFLSASLAGTGDSFQMTLSTEVPEPFTILGSLSALGAGTLMKKQHDKRQKKVKSDA